MKNKEEAGQRSYEVCEGWGRVPEGWEMFKVAGVAVDSRNCVYVFNRSEHPLIVFDREGNLLTWWGEGMFVTPHGICIDAEDCVYLADMGAHVVQKFTREGKHLMTLGTKGEAKEGAPFNRPTGVAASLSGEIYVSDGYGNSLVHRFSAGGSLLGSWGSPGDGPGEFNLPHGICVDARGRVYVADRENNRIQVFAEEGEFLTEWGDFILPNDVFIDNGGQTYVAEGGHRVSILDSDGRLILRFGREGSAPGEFNFAHGICTDSRGDLYVTEIFGQRIQKFRQIGKRH